MNPAELTSPSASTLDFATGDMVPYGRAVTRRLSEMGRAFANAEAVASLLGQGQDPVIYRSFRHGAPSKPATSPT